MLHGPSFIIMHVPNVNAARTFYTERLGFQVQDEQPGFVQFASTGGATLALAEQGAGGLTELWWFVDDADATHEDLKTRGVEIVSPPKDEPFGRALAIKDTAGNTLYLLQLATQGGAAKE
jgi:predicted enzyme related to lactoylglutathione lyase